jgi:hypothetical protein
MFDYFNHCRGVETAESLVTIRQRSLDQPDAGFPMIGQPVKLQPKSTVKD